MKSSAQLQLTRSMPICYRLEGSHLVDSLPYCSFDGQLTNVERNKVAYLIKTQQELIRTQLPTQLNYLQRYQSILPTTPSTPFINSQLFQSRYQSIITNRQQKPKEFITIPTIDAEPQQKPKKGGKKITNKQKNIIKEKVDENIAKVQTGILSYNYNTIRQLNIQISNQLNPTIMKLIIASLDNQHHSLLSEIQKQTKQIQDINKKRKYQQIEAEQRERTIKDRIKVMIYKRRKLNDTIEQ